MTTPTPVKLYNTLSRSLDTLTPVNPGEVKLYCCGPTVYHFQHIGNLRTYIFEDLLVRTLRAAGYKVTHVMNITDVGHLVSDGDAGEDKMAVAAKREGKKSEDIAKYYTDVFFEDCAKLNIARPSVVCNATQHIQEMIELIKRLEANGCTYVRGGNVYFDITKDADYGKLARLDLSKQESADRIDVDSNKKNPHDFVLWFTKSKFEGQELQWDSPWGRGYPGWHIECSAMSMKYLGEQFDIHCGGIDHIPVHHTNEIAQAECATGKSWVSIWMHGGFLVNESKEKMAKSKGGFTCVKDLLDKGFDPMAYRLLCLGTHYRTQLTFGSEAMQGATQSFEKLKRSVLTLLSEGAPDPGAPIGSKEGEALRTAFFKEMQDDLNAPKALAVFWSVLSSKELSPKEKLSLLYQFDTVFGLGIEKWREEKVEIPDEILKLAQERDDARKAKEWKRSDELRAIILEKGYVVEDGPQGQRVKKA